MRRTTKLLALWLAALAACSGEPAASGSGGPTAAAAARDRGTMVTGAAGM
jgi:hypothetical protein